MFKKAWGRLLCRAETMGAQGTSGNQMGGAMWGWEKAGRGQGTAGELGQGVRCAKAQPQHSPWEGSQAQAV